ncbi:MAG: GNAT family N-acetyltransferase [Cytophagales bacterium]|nr:GNAT family N-acetyltransferase [Cytophagales bacterium]
MEKLVIKDNSYHFIKDFKHDEVLRKSFNSMTETHFGFSLEDWYQSGYWGDYYVPYALIDGKEVVSNVSINRLEFVINGQAKLGIQIGTVMTDEAYRKRGLNKYLLLRVLEDWKGQADFIYLFANDSVLDFYPKFGFESLEEYQYSRSVNSDSTSAFRKLNIENNDDLALLKETVNQSVPVSKISVRDHASMILFYGMSFMKESIYLLEELKTIVFADQEGDTLVLHEVFCKRGVDLNEVIQKISSSNINQVKLGFTPLDISGLEKSLITGEDQLFMLQDQSNFFKENQWMFPIMSHA